MADPKTPPPGGASFLAQILKNAGSAPRHEVAKAGLETRFCKNCGGNRTVGTDLTKCDFCGASFVDETPCKRCGAKPAAGSDPARCQKCGAARD
jgi:hypothetical protein